MNRNKLLPRHRQFSLISHGEDTESLIEANEEDECGNDSQMTSGPSQLGSLNQTYPSAIPRYLLNRPVIKKSASVHHPAHISNTLLDANETIIKSNSEGTYGIPLRFQPIIPKSTRLNQEQSHHESILITSDEDPPNTDPQFDSIELKINNQRKEYKCFKFATLPTISRNNSWLFIWFYFTHILHSINLLMSPILLGWIVLYLNPFWIFCYIAYDFILLIDCYLRCTITFMDKFGIEIKDKKIICKHFLYKQSGWIVLVASLPWDLFIFSGTNMLGINCLFQFKVWAILRFIKMIFQFPFKRAYEMNIPSVAIPISRLIKTMLVLLLIGHVDACIFWFMEVSYINGPGRWMDYYELVHAPFSTQYLVSFLSALKSLVLKLRDVKKDAENIYVIFEFIAGILAYGTVFGNIHAIVEMLDHTVMSNHAGKCTFTLYNDSFIEEKHRFEMQLVRDYMRKKKIEPELQQMITSHKETQWRRSQGMDEAGLFDDLPKYVKQQVKNYLYLDLVQKVPLFQDTDIQFQHSVTLKIKPLHFIQGCFIFRKDDDGQEMFFIHAGQVEIIGDQGQVFVTLGPGSFFGEIALFKSN